MPGPICPRAHFSSRSHTALSPHPLSQRMRQSHLRPLETLALLLSAAQPSYQKYFSLRFPKVREPTLQVSRDAAWRRRSEFIIQAIYSPLRYHPREKRKDWWLSEMAPESPGNPCGSQLFYPKHYPVRLYTLPHSPRSYSRSPSSTHPK